MWEELGAGVVASAAFPDACLAVDCHFSTPHTTVKAAPCSMASATAFAPAEGQLQVPGGVCLNGGQGPATPPCKPGEWYRADQIQVDSCAESTTTGWIRLLA